MLIRERAENDLPRLEEILRETYRRDAYPLRPENASVAWLVRNGGLAWVLVVDEVVVGHVALNLGSTGPGVEIVRFFLAPEARGTGAAPVLLRHALDEAHARAGGAWLVVMPHNTAAVAAYGRAGLVPDGEDGWTDVEGTWHPLLRFRTPERARVSS